MITSIYVTARFIAVPEKEWLCAPPDPVAFVLGVESAGPVAEKSPI